LSFIGLTPEGERSIKLQKELKKEATIRVELPCVISPQFDAITHIFGKSLES